MKAEKHSFTSTAFTISGFDTISVAFRPSKSLDEIKLTCTKQKHAFVWLHSEKPRFDRISHFEIIPISHWRTLSHFWGDAFRNLVIVCSVRTSQLTPTHPRTCPDTPGQMRSRPAGRGTIWNALKVRKICCVRRKRCLFPRRFLTSNLIHLFLHLTFLKCRSVPKKGRGLGPSTPMRLKKLYGHIPQLQKDRQVTRSIDRNSARSCQQNMFHLQQHQQTESQRQQSPGGRRQQPKDEPHCWLRVERARGHRQRATVARSETMSGGKSNIYWRW